MHNLPDNKHNGDHGQHGGRNDNNKVQHLPLQWRHLGLGLVCQLGDATKNGLITCAYDDTNTAPQNTMRALKPNIERLEVVGVGVVDGCGHRLGLACQDRSVELGIRRDLKEAHVGGELVSGPNGHHVTWNDINRGEAQSAAVANHLTVFWEHTLDRGHDAGRRPVLEHVETSLDKEDSQKHNG